MLAKILRHLISLRYSVSLSGSLPPPQTRGTLILPNHPAEVDPLIVTTLLWEELAPRPVVLESVYNLPLLRPIFERLRAIPIADMDFDSGPYKIRRIQRTLETISNALQQGDNILIYPSGRLSRNGPELLGGASGVYTIIKECPNAQVLLTRTRGLCGSIFSKVANSGASPNLGLACIKGIKILLQNLIFFTPRRAVYIELSFNPSDLPKNGDLKSFNRYLEAFYNSPQPEAPTLISHSRLFNSIPEITPTPIVSDRIEDIPKAISDKVFNRVALLAQVHVDTLTPETKLGDDLGIDSLTVAELLIWLDREFEIHDVELSELITIGSIVRAAAGQLTQANPRPEFNPGAPWRGPDQHRPKPDLRAAATIAEAFLMAASLFDKHPAIGDARSGIVRWSDAKLRVVTLARHLSQLPASNIGILLPAAASTAIATMATILAGKVPVFLNWTAGKRSLLHACETAQIETVLSAESFLDILPTDLEFLEDRLLLLDHLARDLSIKDKIAGKRLSQESASQILDAFGQRGLNPDKTAVILFTSGSEALPKGVPLSHRNIMSNVKGALDAFNIRSEDILLGFLPPFHSFGLTICTLLPLMTGLRVAYHPNPNESRKLAKTIENWGVTIAAGTPTFLRSILKAGLSPEQFSSLRALISGAERAPDELFELAKSINPKTEILEGYGITECSPVVSVARPGEARLGVGRPISGVKIAIVDPESQQALPEGEQGLILIQGEGVFSGYLEPKIEPFIEHRRERWYNSGDLGYLKNGSLVITGRLKRFIKIAGEMISLGAVEEALEKVVVSPDGAPTVAILAQGSEGDGRPKLVAFVAGELSTQDANKILKEAGFPPLVHVSELRQISSLPLLGSGKVDYQSLKEQI